jgi:hypothetical protein
MNLSIASELEECSLTVYEFRIYLHLAALEQTQQAARNCLLMAQTCQISERQVRRALTSLLEKKLIRITSRTQQARTFSLTPVLEWSVSAAPRHHRPFAFEANRPTSPILRCDAPIKRPDSPILEPEFKRPTRPERSENPVKHAKLETNENPNGLPDRSETVPQTGLDLDVDVEVNPFFQEQDLSLTSTSTTTTPAYQTGRTEGLVLTGRTEGPVLESRTTLLEEAGLLDAALEVCSSQNQTILDHRLAALELDLTRLGRGKIARALHASLENATQSRWGYYRAVLATQGTREQPASQTAQGQTASQTGSVQTACQSDMPTRDTNLEMPKPAVKRQKTMAELLATTPLNGTWGRG